jgi:hypothetical protein
MLPLLLNPVVVLTFLHGSITRGFYQLMKLSVVGVNRRGHLQGWHLIMYDEQGFGPLNIFQTPFLICWEIILFLFPKHPPLSRKKVLMSSSTSETCLDGSFIIGSWPRTGESLALCNLVLENLIAYSCRVWVYSS